MMYDLDSAMIRLRNRRHREQRHRSVDAFKLIGRHPDRRPRPRHEPKPNRSPPDFQMYAMSNSLVHAYEIQLKLSSR